MSAQQAQTLEQLLHDRVSQFAASERPKEIIDQHVEKMFASVIDDAFRSYGDMGKAVKEVVTHPDGVQAAREELRQMQLMGKTVLVAGKCDNKHPDGSCAGHQTSEEEAA